MKTLEKFTKEMIEGFILGNQSSYERGDTIDPRKELTFIVTDSGNKFHIKAIWIKGITCYPLVNPMTDKDDVHHFEDKLILEYSIIHKNHIRNGFKELAPLIDRSSDAIVNRFYNNLNKKDNKYFTKEEFNNFCESKKNINNRTTACR